MFSWFFIFIFCLFVFVYFLCFFLTFFLYQQSTNDNIIKLLFCANSEKLVVLANVSDGRALTNRSEASNFNSYASSLIKFVVVIVIVDVVAISPANDLLIQQICLPLIEFFFVVSSSNDLIDTIRIASVHFMSMKLTIARSFPTDFVYQNYFKLQRFVDRFNCLLDIYCDHAFDSNLISHSTRGRFYFACVKHFYSFFFALNIACSLSIFHESIPIQTPEVEWIRIRSHWWCNRTNHHIRKD